MIDNVFAQRTKDVVKNSKHLDLQPVHKQVKEEHWARFMKE